HTTLFIKGGFGYYPWFTHHWKNHQTNTINSQLAHSIHFDFLISALRYTLSERILTQFYKINSLKEQLLMGINFFNKQEGGIKDENILRGRAWKTHCGKTFSRWGTRMDI